MAANDLVSREEDNLRNYSSWIDVTVLDEQTRKVAYRFEMPFPGDIDNLARWEELEQAWDKMGWGKAILIDVYRDQDPNDPAPKPRWNLTRAEIDFCREKEVLPPFRCYVAQHYLDFASWAEHNGYPSVILNGASYREAVDHLFDRDPESSDYKPYRLMEAGKLQGKEIEMEGLSLQESLFIHQWCEQRGILNEIGFVEDLLTANALEDFILLNYHSYYAYLNGHALQDIPRTDLFADRVGQIFLTFDPMRIPRASDKEERPLTIALLAGRSVSYDRMCSLLETYDRQLFRDMEIGLQPEDLLDLIICKVQNRQVALDSAYDALPERFQRMIGGPDFLDIYRINIAERFEGHVEVLPFTLSPEDWHVLISRHPEWIGEVPDQALLETSFWSPLADLRKHKDTLTEYIPDSLLDRVDFQGEALSTGFVKPAQLGDSIHPENYCFLSSEDYPLLTRRLRLSPDLQRLAFGAVWKNAANIRSVPTECVTDVMVRLAAHQDFRLLASLPPGRVERVAMTDQLLCEAAQNQIRSAERARNIIHDIPKCYRTPGFIHYLDAIASMYGVRLDKTEEKLSEGREEFLGKRMTR